MEENKVEDKTEKTFKERYLAGAISAAGTTAMMSVHWLFIWG